MTSSVSASSARLSIGEVLGRLRPDFPDVSISKIRYLESEGLVEPERTPAGYRKFSNRDVERLRYILTAQRENYYPLKVIREHLDAIDRGLHPPASANPDAAAPKPRAPQVVLAHDPSDPDRGAQANLRLSRAELRDSARVSDELLAQLESFGLLRPSAAGHYDATALLVATTAGELAAYGVEPRHLRSVQTSANREIDLLQQVVSPMRRQRDAGAEARAEQTARELASLVLRLHTTLVRAGVGRT
ncbi:MAG: MerR family DNA-binding transcriptional regulator [Nocardioidaceae bacterium]|nr:MerR family DNA-binding transcriptional regulator [Nocardioidaceae bacterium]MDQ3324489.1 MerR family DNA-binding transcriptional regulator [Actinomycetota bacterium]